MNSYWLKEIIITVLIGIAVITVAIVTISVHAVMVIPTSVLEPNDVLDGYIITNIVDSDTVYVKKANTDTLLIADVKPKSDFVDMCVTYCSGSSLRELCTLVNVQDVEDTDTTDAYVQNEML